MTISCNINLIHYRLLKSKKINLYKCDLNDFSKLKKLINKVKHEVYLKTGENLELEIKIIGDEK